MRTIKDIKCKLIISLNPNSRNIWVESTDFKIKTNWENINFFKHIIDSFDTNISNETIYFLSNFCEEIKYQLYCVNFNPKLYWSDYIHIQL